MSAKLEFLFVLACVVATSGTARAECPPDYIDCGTGACCQSSTPVCCPYVCCGSNGRCSADGFDCVPIDDDDDEPEEPEVPTLPTCAEGSVVALNSCGTTDDACGCTHACTTNADCGTGCCSQGMCALACVCAGSASVVTSPTPEQCQAAGGTMLEPASGPPIGGFGGSGCSAGGGGAGALGLALAALLGLPRRRRRARP